MPSQIPTSTATGKPTETAIPRGTPLPMATQAVTPTQKPTDGHVAPRHAAHSHQHEPPPHPGAHHDHPAPDEAAGQNEASGADEAACQNEARDPKTLDQAWEPDPDEASPGHTEASTSTPDAPHTSSDAAPHPPNTPGLTNHDHRH